MFESLAEFVIYDELNDFLPSEKKNKLISYSFNGKPSIKDAIEAIGVPHPEVNLIVVNEKSVGFDYHLRDGDAVSVYPISNSSFEASKVKLREEPPSEFIADVNLGKLARMLRMSGFNTVYKNSYSDHDVAGRAEKEKRLVLTRDRRLLRFKIITHGYWVRATKPGDQIIEVMRRFDLISTIRPFNICLECNGIIEPVEKETILDDLEPKTKLYYDEFYHCVSCEKIYWKGSHYEHMSEQISQISSRV